MSKFSTFDELKSKRKEMVKSMKENDAFEGIKNLLTELYPDKAHFIFELLQNAEDMNATEVNFSLYNDRLIFMHNGNKRAFTLTDVEAITNISKGTKKMILPRSDNLELASRLSMLIPIRRKFIQRNIVSKS